MPSALLSPSHSPETDSRPERSRSGLSDAFLTVLILTFAFLVASTPARNSDVWLHLASGRLLSHGHISPGVDSFAYTSQGATWVDHSWLFDLGLLAGYRTLGQAFPVLLVALSTTVLAGLMLRLGTRRGPFWLTAACVLLALLTMSSRLLVQPSSLSLLFLGVCLTLLDSGGRALFGLPCVVALWVNVDAWFVLGPLVVVLWWLGSNFAPGERMPLWPVPACFVACLVSPHHVQGLTLPTEFSPAVWMCAFRTDPRFAHLFASPWPPASTPVGWAYVVLLVLGLGSFFADVTALRSGRFLVWLTFACLSAWNARLVPFFAVVAGPITAQNLGPQVAGWRPRTPVLVVSLGSMAFLGLTWPGWIHGYPHGKPVDWRLAPNPSLVRVARTLEEWRQQGKLTGRIFAAHPDVAHHLSWFAPGEKSFLDSRLPLFTHVARDYEKLAGLLATDSVEGWSLLDSNGIDCLVLYDSDRRRLAEDLAGLVRNSQRWDLLHIDGNASIVTRKGSLPAIPRFDPERLAFAEPVAPQPQEGVNLLPAPRSWWDQYMERPAGSTWEAGAAAVYLRLFEEGAGRDPGAGTAFPLARHGADLAVQGSGPGAFVGIALRAMVPGVFQGPGPAPSHALPILAIRSGRAAVSSNPADGGAWLILAEAYQAMAGASPLPVAEIRYIQEVAALYQAVYLQPDHAAAHQALASLFTERRFLDLALHHRSEQLRLLRQVPASLRGDPSRWSEYLEGVERTTAELRRIVQDNENRFLVRTHGLAGDPLGRAHLAVRLGLAGKARDDVLLRSHPDLYGVEGLRLLLELLTTTGQLQNARELLDREELRRSPEVLGSTTLPCLASNAPGGYRVPAYDWYDLCVHAGSGNYEESARTLGRLGERLRKETTGLATQVRGGLAWRLASEVGVSADSRFLALRLHAAVQRVRLVEWLDRIRMVPVQRGDLFTLSGLLQFEGGRLPEAREQLRRALEQYAASGEGSNAAGSLLARRFLDRLSSGKEQ